MSEKTDEDQAEIGVECAEYFWAALANKVPVTEGVESVEFCG